MILFGLVLWTNHAIRRVPIAPGRYS
jgi:hypothetical protein